MGQFQKGNKIGHRFTSTDQPKNPGRKPKLKSIPADAQDKVYSALYTALTMDDVETAGMYLMKQAEQLPECGFIIQVYAKGLMGKNALAYASDIMDRLFGKAKQVTEIGITKEIPVLITEQEKAAIEKWTAREDDDSGL